MDKIAEKIHLSEYRIDNGRQLLNWPLQACPLLILAAGLISGIILQELFGILGIWFLLTIFVFVVAAVLKFHCRKLSLAVALGFVALMLVGAVQMHLLANPGSNHISSITSVTPVNATIKGIVISEPVDNLAKQATEAENYSISFYLKVSEILTNDGFQPASGNVYARMSFIPSIVAPSSVLQKGDVVTFYCRLDRPNTVLERWQFDFRKFLYYKNIEICAYSQYPAIIREDTSKVAKSVLFQSGVENDKDDAAALIDALTLGERTNLTVGVVEAFRTTGLMHILSLSGLHVGIITCGLWGLLRLFGVKQRLAGMIVIAVITLFLCKVTLRPPVVRACIIAFAFAFSKVFGRRSLAINTLSLSAIITLLMNPRDIFAPGWQLSFICVLGIILLTSPIARWIVGIKYNLTNVWFGSRSDDEDSSPDLSMLSLGKAKGWFISAVSASLAAWISSFPIIVYHFGVVYVFSWIYTVLLTPLLWVIINFAFLDLITGSFFTAVTNWLADILIYIVNLFAEIPYSEILTGFVPFYIALTVVFTIILFAFSEFLLNKTLRRVSVGLVLISVVLVVVWDYREFDNDSLRATLLPVGHGQCVVMEMPGGKVVMLDCGSSNFSDCGQRIAMPYLRSRRRREIDTLIISHPHDDHINGLEAIFDKYSPKSVFCNSDYEQLNGNAKVLRGQGQTIFDDDGRWMIDVWPGIGEFKSINDRCLVVFVDAGGKTILFPSDIEKDRQRELVALGVRTDILVMPHHGSIVTTIENFAEKMGATEVIQVTPEESFSPKTLIID